MTAEEITEIDPVRCVLRVGDELIYLPDWPKGALVEFCQRHNVTMRARYDVWSDILAPYVDTSFPKVAVAARSKRLKVAGFGAIRVFKTRLIVAVPILLFQGIAGEWTGLYHYDLMYSFRMLRLFGLYGVAYRAAMRIALEPYHENA